MNAKLIERCLPGAYVNDTIPNEKTSLESSELHASILTHRKPTNSSKNWLNYMTKFFSNTQEEEEKKMLLTRELEKLPIQ